MPSTEAHEESPLFAVGGAALSLAGGILLLVTSVRDYLLYLDSYDLGMVGTTGSLGGVVVLSLLGSLLIVVSLRTTLALSAGR